MRSSMFDSTQWDIPPPSRDHSHRVHHALSRRAFIGSMAGAASAAVGAGLFPVTALAQSTSPAPKPSTNAITINGVTFHFTFFGPTIDPSSITDFNGSVGVADVQGAGIATNPDGSTETLLFDTDVRFMSGIYVGMDGAVHKGTFGFV